MRNTQDYGLMPERILTVDAAPPVLTSEPVAQSSTVSFSVEQPTEVRIETPDLKVFIKSPASLEEVCQSAEKLYATYRDACAPRTPQAGFTSP
ncbi:hypothetical protein [Micromonospora sp. CA-111912]|uniref:hypothetical protein n=1 Tax=Micromonospora sp. CA-111912 TaxID=3239955 RepID=UPI003D93CC23